VAGLDKTKVAEMSGAQRSAVRDALVAAYPNRGRLEELLDRLDKPLAHFAGEYVPLPEVVFKVVERARAEGWLPRLLAEATVVNPGNAQLAAVIRQYRVATSTAGGAAAAAGSAPRTGGARSSWPAALPSGVPTDREVIRELADQFPHLADARQIVAEAGMAPGGQPGWNVSSADSFWWEVHRRFEGGAVIGGWPQVLRAACEARPGNVLLVAAAVAAGVAAASPQGVSASTDQAPAELFPPTGGNEVSDAPAPGGTVVDQGAATSTHGESWDFFVSYTQVDQRWAEWIAWTLEEAGYRVLLQAWDMPGGANWVVGMQNGVEHAARTVAVLSAAYGRSVYGAAEWQAAWRADPAGADRRLLVFRIEDCARPGMLGQVVSRDLFGVPQDIARVTLLQAARLAVGGGRAKPDARPPFPGGDTPPFPPADQ
jgi:hypothetical protein